MTVAQGKGSRWSCLRCFPCGPPGVFPSSILFLPAAGHPCDLTSCRCGILHVEALCALSAMFSLSRGASVAVLCFARPLHSCERKQYRDYRMRSTRRGRAATRWSDTGMTSAHNASLAPLLALRHCQGDTSFPFSAPFVASLPVFANRTGRSLMSHL